MNSNSSVQISKVGLLATGEELVTGDINNSNGQYIARKLFDLGFHIGMHITVGDQEDEILKAIQYLLIDHDILIITGGLGPTSDDRTRFALSKAIQKQLIFDEAAWQTIQLKLDYRTFIPASNKQQALFPEGSVILPNPNGTASGCFIAAANKFIFMLPGPPVECLNMFDNEVLPRLISLQKNENIQQLKWRLFGVSEGEMAEKLDQLVSEYHCITGYRWDFPYLEFKVRGFAPYQYDELVNLINQVIKPYIICTTELSASELLIQALRNIPYRILIHDDITCGLLQHTLLNSETMKVLQFTSLEIDAARQNLYLQTTENKNLERASNAENLPMILIEIKGKNILWQDDDSKQTGIEIVFKTNNIFDTHSHTIPYRKRNMVCYAVEFICHKIFSFLQDQKML